MNIIGLAGPARSGKDAAAQIILDHAGPGVVRQGFADKLKISAALALGFDGRPAKLIARMDALKVNGVVATFLNEDGLAADRHVSGREFLQRYGTESHRGVFGDDFWLDAVLPEGRDDASVLVIPDVRFENEARRIHERGGEVWRVERPGVTSGGHVSEAGLPDDLVDRVLVNDGSLEDWADTVIVALANALIAARRTAEARSFAGVGVPERPRRRWFW